jgi:hypothetical protein
MVCRAKNRGSRHGIDRAVWRPAVDNVKLPNARFERGGTSLASCCNRITPRKSRSVYDPCLKPAIAPAFPTAVAGTSTVAFSTAHDPFLLFLSCCNRRRGSRPYPGWGPRRVPAPKVTRSASSRRHQSTVAALMGRCGLAAQKGRWISRANFWSGLRRLLSRTIRESCAICA